MPSEPSPNPPPALTQGDFVRLLMRNEPALRAYSRSLLPDWHLVDEVIQEASVTLWEKFDQLRDEAGFLPWAKVVARFEVLGWLRDKGRDRLVLNEEVGFFRGTYYMINWSTRMMSCSALLCNVHATAENGRGGVCLASERLLGEQEVTLCLQRA